MEGHHEEANSEDCTPELSESSHLVNACVNTDPGLGMFSLSGNMLLVKVGDVITRALLDTGAGVSLVSQTLLEKLQLGKVDTETVKQYPKFRGANLEPLEIKGQITFDIEIEDVTTSLTCLVTPKLPVPLILGWKWMQENDVIIRPNTATMAMWAPNLLTVLPDLEDPEPIILSLTTDLTIKPWTMMQCALYVNNKVLAQVTRSAIDMYEELPSNDENAEYELHITPHSDITPTGALLPEGLVLVNNEGIAYVKIANPGFEPIVLEEHTKIAIAVPAEDFDIEDGSDIHGRIVALIHEVEESVELEGSVGTQTEVTAPVHYFDSEVFQPNVLRMEERDKSTLEPIDWAQLLPNDVLTSDQRNQLIAMLDANRDVFATSVQQVGRVSCVKHEIKLKPDARIVRQRPYRLSPEKQQALDAQVQELLLAKVVVESDSPWQSPVVMVKKRNKAPDGSDLWRTCIDYRALNALTLKDTGYFAMPTFDDLYDSISRQRPQWMSSLDMLSGYYQIEMDESSQDYTTFNTGKGSYKFLRCPFGLSLAPFSYSRAMHAALSRLGQTFVWFYLDDVFVASRTFKDHLKHLQKVFNQFRQYGFTVHPHKCDFARKKLKFLGHIWTNEGIQPDPSKVEAMSKFPAPTSVTEVRRWLGLSGYYRRFVKNYSKLAYPITELTKKDQDFHWSTECQEAMDEIKKALLENAVLYYPKLDREFVLNTDASTHSISSILSQKDDEDVLRPVAFFSMKLAPAQQVWDINSKEAFALVMSIRLHRHLIGTNKLQVITDNLTTRYLQGLKRSSAPKLLRWALELQGLNMEIKHAPGRTIQAVDALSRMPSGNAELNDHPNKSQLEQPLYDEIVMHIAEDRSRSSISDLMDLFRDNSRFQDEVTKQATRAASPAAEGDSIDSDSNEDQENDQLQLAYPKLLIPEDEKLMYQNFLSDVNDLKKQQLESEDFKYMIAYLKFNTLPRKNKMAAIVLNDHPNFILGDDGLLYHLFSPSRRKEEHSYIAQLCLPTQYRGYVIQEYHDSLLGAHRGTVKLYAAIRQRYYWPKMQADITTYVKTCQACQKGKHATSSRKAPMELRHVYPIWYHMHMDVVSLPTDPANGYTKCLVMIDSFSSYVEMTAVADEKAETLATALFRHWICRHSVPAIITTDRHQSFKSNLLKELLRLLGTKHIFTTANRPQSNSKVERMNGSIVNMLRVLAAKRNNWVELLPTLRFALNTGENASSKYSPYFLAHGVLKGSRAPIKARQTGGSGPARAWGHENHEL